MEHVYVFLTLAASLGLFVWGRLRHDVVALLALFSLVLSGIIPADEAFAGFGHPAVITVAAVLIIGKALENSGVIEVLARWVAKVGDNLSLQILTLSLLVTVASAFMNNVGALAIIMPVVLHIARKSNHAPSYLLMPIAFASLFGGMITLIGTPPNIIIASLRADETGASFGMFDFAPVGLGLALMGVLFIALIGWRLLPKRVAPDQDADSFHIDDYITEVRVTKKSKVVGMTIEALGQSTKGGVQILGLIRNSRRIHAPDPQEELQIEDIIIIECDTVALKSLVESTGLELVGDRKFRKDAKGSHSITIMEAIVVNNAAITGRTAAGLRMRTRYGINLLAVSRQGKSIHDRLDRVVFKKGDVIMVQGRTLNMDEAIRSMGCLPLAQRKLQLGYKKKITLALTLFIASIAVVILGWLPVHISFSMAAAGLVLSGVLPVKETYTSIDWPVIVLLGAMLPVGKALETSGGAELLTEKILLFADGLPVWATLGLLILVTMLLSGVINNAATVILMAPIGIGIGVGMGLSVDPFLMAIAVGASASFLTPIGHQSNTLVMGPGGYRFSDYFRMGLPVSIITILLAVPLILYFWPV